MILTVICLATLVLYIHGISWAIQAPNVIQHSADDVDATIKRLFSEGFADQVLGTATPEQTDETELKSAGKKLDDDFDGSQFVVNCCDVGYFQAIEHETMMEINDKYEFVIRFPVRPGDFLFAELKRAEVWSKSVDSASNPVEMKEFVKGFKTA